MLLYKKLFSYGELHYIYTPEKFRKNFEFKCFEILCQLKEKLLMGQMAPVTKIKETFKLA